MHQGGAGAACGVLRRRIFPSVPLLPDKEMDQRAAGLRAELHTSAGSRRGAADAQGAAVGAEVPQLRGTEMGREEVPAISQ